MIIEVAGKDGSRFFGGIERQNPLVGAPDTRFPYFSGAAVTATAAVQDEFDSAFWRLSMQNLVAPGIWPALLTATATKKRSRYVVSRGQHISSDDE